MATYRKRGKNSWFAEVSCKGQRTSKTFTIKAEAIAWATEKETQIRTATYSSPLSAKDKTFLDLCLEFEERILPNRKDQDTDKVRLGIFKKKISWINKKLRDINSEDITNWRDSRLKEVAPSTVNRELNSLSTLFETARSDWKWIMVNPVRGIKRPKVPPPRDRRISQEEQNAILAALQFEIGKPPKLKKQHLGAAFLFALETGMCRGEILALRWEKISLDKRFLIIPTSKNGDKRKVPLSIKAIELLKLQSMAAKSEVCFPINRDAFRSAWRRARDKAEIEDLTFHDTGHEAITRLAKKLDVLDLARMVGHRDLKSLMIYYNATPEEIALRLG